MLTELMTRLRGIKPTRAADERGMMFLGFALATALLSSIAAAAALYSVRGGAGMNALLLRTRPQARYAAEAGIVRGYERLYANGNDPAYLGETLSVDVDGDGVSETSVIITVTAPDAAGRRKVSARVNY